LHGNFFTLDLNAARAAFETMPWVRNASVRRLWPDQMNVTLEEYRPLGTWGDTQLVSVDGDVFTVNQGEVDTNKLPAFAGPSGSAKDVLDKYREFIQWFAPLGISPVQVRLSPRYAWSVKFSNGMTVELGREFDSMTLAQRCARLIGAWSELLKNWGTQIRSIDLRYPNGFAVRLANTQMVNVGSMVGAVAKRATQSSRR
jgi:cell division protein FtsQ